MEQKKVTQGFMTLLSDDGGRYMASEKQVSNNLSNSVLKERISTRAQSVPPEDGREWGLELQSTQTVASPVQVVDVVEGGGLSEAHSGLPDVFAAVDGLHALYRVLRVEKNQSCCWTAFIFLFLVNSIMMTVTVIQAGGKIRQLKNLLELCKDGCLYFLLWRNW